MHGNARSDGRLLGGPKLPVQFFLFFTFCGSKFAKCAARECLPVADAIARRKSNYVAAKATYIRLLHGKIGILEGFFGPSSVHRARTHIVLG